MLFQITHHHDENTCPAHDQESAVTSLREVIKTAEALRS